MKSFKLIIFLFFACSTILMSQNDTNFTVVNTNVGILKILGSWDIITTIASSGQIYYQNKEGIIIALAQNPQKAYSFYKKSLSNFENVVLFYVWDSEYYKSQNYYTQKLKESRESEYIIWKYNDKKMDNIFLFGSNKMNFLNLLIYTNIWNEERKITFLENLYKINKIQD